MEIIEDREEYTFFEATENAMTPDSMLSDIYEVVSNQLLITGGYALRDLQSNLMQ